MNKCVFLSNYAQKLSFALAVLSFIEEKVFDLDSVRRVPYFKVHLVEKLYRFSRTTNSLSQQTLRLFNIATCEPNIHVSLEYVGHWFKPLSDLTSTNQNSVAEEIKSRVSSRNACHHSVQNLSSSSLLSKNLKIKIYRTIILPVFVWV